MEELMIQAMFDKVTFDKAVFVQNVWSRIMGVTDHMLKQKQAGSCNMMF